ncbi:MAG: hypothetical protein GX869_07615 [Candidatus Cloacimonetes bacterium]|nr:hypothetical protein [Candidatus Cloacimonadota bacterium]
MKIALDSGHNAKNPDNGYLDCGAVNGKYTEADLAEKLKLSICQYLKGYIDYFVPNYAWNTQDRYREAIKNKCDYYLVIHMDSASSSASGVHALYNDKGKEFANDLVYYICRYLGFANRGAKHYSTNPRAIAAFDIATIPFVLLECGFISNNNDLQMHLQEREYIAQAIVSVIAKYSKVQNIKLKVGDVLASIDNTTHKLITAPQIINGRTVLGLRDVSNIFHCQILWHPTTKEITILRKEEI